MLFIYQLAPFFLTEKKSRKDLRIICILVVILSHFSTQPARNTAEGEVGSIISSMRICPSVCTSLTRSKYRPAGIEIFDTCILVHPELREKLTAEHGLPQLTWALRKH